MSRGARISWGIIIGLFVLTFVVSGLRGGIRSDSVLVIELSGPIEEQKAQGAFAQLFGPKVTLLHNVLDAIDHARDDERITGLVVKISSPSLGWAKAQEIRSRLLEFRKSAKPSVCYLHGDLLGNRDYYLASACEFVWSVPTAPLGLSGLMTQSLFIRGTLDKLGVYPDFYGIEDYKTARNFYTEKKYTPAHREMADSLMRNIYASYVADTAAARKIDRPWFEKVLADGPYTPPDALERKLIDKSAYWDEVQEFFRGKSEDKEWRPVQLSQYVKETKIVGMKKIAVVHATGTIVVGESDADPSGDFLMGSESVSADLRRARTDNSVAAIILRVDSPGGSAVASEIIRREVQLAAKAKPVVVSMSDVAGSGGYWISMSANKIVADGSTITGSIGVVFGKMNISGLYALLGLSTDSLYTSENATFLDFQRNFTPAQRETVRRFMQDIYVNFKRGVAEGRGMKPEEVEKVARGRVWTGAQGKEIGLVDEIGGFDRALALAKDLAKIDAKERVTIVRFPEEKTFWQSLLELGGSSSVHSAAITARIKQWASQPPSVQARMPFEISIR
jgi:protease-4